MASEIQDMAGQLSNNLATGIAKKVVERTVSDTDIAVAEIEAERNNQELISVIGNYAFAYCSKFVAPSFNTCSKVMSMAFASCESLASINLPSCAIVGDYAFYDCSNLEHASFDLCDTYSGGGSYILERTSLYYSAGYVEWTGSRFERPGSFFDWSATVFGWAGTNAFDHCSNLKSIMCITSRAIPSGLFACEHIGFVYNLPSSSDMDYLGYYNYEKIAGGGYRIHIENANFPSAIGIEEGAFQYNQTILNVEAPKVSYIKKSAFAGCFHLSSVSFPECIRIDEEAFKQCNNFTSVSFPKCKHIGSSAFESCYSLKSAYFPECIRIGAYAFRGASRYVGYDSEWHTIQEFGMMEFLYFPKVGVIESWAFERQSYIRDVSMPQCEVVQAGAFNHCTSLVTAYLPQCLRTDDFAFQYCTALRDVNLSNCRQINDYCFHGCANLEELDLVSCADIEYAAFAGCNNLFSISLPLCSRIDMDAFHGCRALSSISLPRCTDIYTDAFRGCINLSAVYLGASERCILRGKPFKDTPIANGSGHIYVPRDLYEDYTYAGALSKVNDKSMFQPM